MDKDYRSSRRADGASSADRSQPRRYAVEKQASSSSYAGRFGSSAEAGSRRPTGSYRSQPAGSYRSRMDYESGRRASSAHTGGDSYTRRPEKKADKAAQAAPAASAKPTKSTKRNQHRRRQPGHALSRVILALAIVLVVVVLLLVLCGDTRPVHQLPTVERAALLTEAL